MTLDEFEVVAVAHIKEFAAYYRKRAALAADLSHSEALGATEFWPLEMDEPEWFEQLAFFEEDPDGRE